MLRTTLSRAYSVKMPELVLFDLDSTLFETYGKQEGGAFNFHYQANGYHPLLCFDGITGDLLKIELRPGTQYCCNGAADFMRPLLEEYQEKYPNIALFPRGDSGFATSELYRVCEDNGTSYVIRLKENGVLRKLASELDLELYDLTRENVVSYAVVYGEFEYQAGSWDYPRRVVCKVEKPYSVYTVYPQFYDVCRQRSQLQNHQTAFCIQFPVYILVVRKVDAEPSGNPIFQPRDLALCPIPQVRQRPQISIDSFRNVWIAEASIAHQPSYNFRIFSTVLRRIIVIQLFRLLYVIWIHVNRLHPVFHQKVAEIDPIMSCRLHSRYYFCHPEFHFQFFQPGLEFHEALFIVAELECLC